jgi:hypothetical protein
LAQTGDQSQDRIPGVRLRAARPSDATEKYPSPLVKQETARLTGDRLMEAEGRTEEAEARLCETYWEIITVVRRLRQLYGVPL